MIGTPLSFPQQSCKQYLYRLSAAMRGQLIGSEVRQPQSLIQKGRAHFAHRGPAFLGSHYSSAVYVFDRSLPRRALSTSRQTPIFPTASNQILKQNDPRFALIPRKGCVHAVEFFRVCHRDGELAALVLDWDEDAGLVIGHADRGIR